MASPKPTVAPIAAPNPDDPQTRTVDRLKWRGGLDISHPDKRWGGLSGLDISPDGRRLLAVTDRGSWVAATLTYRNGNLTGIEDITIHSIRRPDGRPARGGYSDAEALAPDGKGGFFVGYERMHRIWHYRSLGSGDFREQPSVLGAPPGAAGLPRNGGIEGMARLCDGRLLVLSEKARVGDDAVRAWVVDGRAWAPRAYATTGSFHPTGAVTLPDCSVLVLERSFSIASGVRARIALLPEKSFAQEGVLRSEEIAQLVPPVVVDNMEGIAVRHGPAGETLIYIVSDDNFSALQRTLLMMFELLPARRPRQPARATRSRASAG